MTQLQGLHPHTREFLLPWQTVSAGKAATAENLPSASGPAWPNPVMRWNGGGDGDSASFTLLALPVRATEVSRGSARRCVPLGSPSEKDYRFSCYRTRYELTSSPCHWDSAWLSRLKAHFLRNPQQGLTQRETRAWLSLLKQVSSTGQFFTQGSGSWIGPGQICRFSVKLLLPFSFSGAGPMALLA